MDASQLYNPNKSCFRVTQMDGSQRAVTASDFLFASCQRSRFERDKGGVIHIYVVCTSFLDV